MMLGNSNGDVRCALLIVERAAHRRRPQTLPSRAFVYEAARNIQFIDIEGSAGILGLAFGVGDGAAQHVLHIARGARAKLEPVS